MVGVITGIAVGLMHLVKSGPLVAAAAGLVVLAAGLTLLIAGSVGLIRLLPGWWRLLAIPAAYVVLEFVLFPVASGVYAANVPAGHLDGVNPASRGLAYTVVWFEASDGARLAGWWVPSHNGAAVIVAAGSGSTRAAVLDQGVVLARHGYGVLFMDNRGHGPSGGTAMDFGWWGERDLYGAVSYLENRPEVTNGRVAILGESMGGEEAIGAIGSDPRVRAVIAEGVTGRTFADTARLGSGLTDLISRFQSSITYTTAGILSRAPHPPSLRTSLRLAAPRPVLIIAGRDEITAGRFLQSGPTTNVQLLAMPDTAHTAGLRTHATEWEATVVQFLAQNL
jgi:pimeloyl-ACP methyl ester carboxylesterase